MKIKSETFHIKGAPITGTNPLPRFRGRKHISLSVSPDFPKELSEECGYLHRVLPYLMQDRYSKERRDLSFKSFVLENEYLRAIFLPELGGRIHSLYDKKAGRELLFANKVIQPGNIATRNAWLSGGIEWNLGNIGHCYTTCDNVFAAVLCDGEGNDFLRIWEFERNKSIFWQVDFHLPDGSPRLFVHVKTVNPFDKDTTTYWWTNVAVPIDTKTRVLASSKKVISFIDNVCHYETLPYLAALGGVDATYPENAPRSFDYFIQREGNEESTWECAAYEDGVVFYERSTAPLYYKKLFAWGTHPAGMNWQHALSDGPGTGYYAEIQAGIAPSQLHDKIMPAGATYEWTQCFGGVKLDSQRLFDENYGAAVSYFDEKINEMITAEGIAALDEKYCRLACLVPEARNILHRGSGFGALEIRRMKIDGDGTPPASMPFPEDTLGEEQAIWLHLLENGVLPECAPERLPTSYMVSEKWMPRIMGAAEKAPTWQSLLHYGVAAYEYERLDVIANKAFDDVMDKWQTEEAKRSFIRSAELAPNLCAYRNLAVIANAEGDKEAANAYYESALALPEALNDQGLVSEYMDFLAKNREYARTWEMFEKLPAPYKSVDRIRISAAYAAVRLGYFDYLEDFFAEDHCDVREGEVALTDIWFEYSAIRLARERGIENPDKEALERLIDEAWEKCPPPSAIDFRQSTNKRYRYRV